MKTYLLNTNLGVRPRRTVVRGEHHSYKLQDGRTVYDASCGAGVANFGRTNEEVMKAMIKVMEAGLSYVPSSVFDTLITERLAQTLVESTGGQMRKVIFYGSGSIIDPTFSYRLLTS
jgi:adenosylmethionine-8-amino-7-oxononanoate aminotransferase